MNIVRILRHLATPSWRVRGVFPPAMLDRIAQAITREEALHSGQIRFIVEYALDPVALIRGLTARDRALDVFSRLGVWDTAQNNGVLVYLLLADRDVEIIADRGIDAVVGRPGWEEICHRMEVAFGRGQYEEGVLAGIESVGRHLRVHFPRTVPGPNELPDQPLVL